MKSRVLRPAITVSTVMAVLIAALAVYAYLTTGTTHADSVFAPTTNAKMCNDLSNVFTDATLQGANGSCVEDLAINDHANVTNTLNIPTGLNFATVVTMSPNTVTIAGGGSMPVGEKIGGLHSNSTLAFFGGPCNQPTAIDFVFYNVALPSSAGDPRSATGPGTHGSSTNIVFPQGTGALVSDRFGHWRVGDVAIATDPTPTSGGISGIIADPSSLAIQNYPSYLLNLFDADFQPSTGLDPDNATVKPLVPMALYGSLTQVSDWIPLYFAQFSSGALATMPAPLGLLTAAQGQPSVSVLNDPTAAAGLSSITSFCTPLGVTTMLLGTTPNGHVRSTNPGSIGTAFFQQYDASLRDLDQDNNENALDTCPSVADPAHNPRTGAGDTDTDGMGNACDIEVGGAGGNTDEDADGFLNPADNCPQISNPTQLQSSLGVPQADNGPTVDSIGDACEGVALAAGGVGSSATFSQNGVPITVDLTNHTVAHGRYMVTLNVIPKCFGGVDLDQDGYCSGQDTPNTDGAVGAPCLSTSPPSCAVRHSAWGAGLASSAINSDNDGFTDAMETYLGTDTTKSCAATTTVGDETISNWPMDFNNDQLSGVLDVSTFSSRFNKPVNFAGGSAPYPNQRWDLNGDGLISVLDVSMFSSTFNKHCGQGVSGMPGPFVQQ